MPRYVWDADASVLVEVVAGPRAPSVAPMVIRDHAPLKTPIGFIDGRAHRREVMKRANVREVEPSEKPSRPSAPSWVNNWRAGRGIERAKPE
jgi:hypothetical protein